MKEYDLIVIGSGPAGEKAAVKAAYFNYRVALIEKKRVLGGAGVNTGTLPSKTLKETAVYLSGHLDKGVFGIDRTLERDTSIEDFMYRKNYVIFSEAEEVSKNLQRHAVDIYQGVGSFQDPHTISVYDKKKGQSEEIRGKYVIIATGSYPYQPENIPFDSNRVLDSDTILNLTRIPKSICVVGAGVIGCEYTTIFATMGIKVFLINRDSEILRFLDSDMSQALVEAMREKKVDIFFNSSVESIDVPESENDLLTVHLDSEQSIHCDMFLYAAGRCGAVQGLNLDKAGVEVGPRERINVNEKYQTNVPHIYAVGDVIGFPSLASTSMDQGRVAVTHIFDTGDTDMIATVFPYGIYTVPEVSMVGISEQEAIAKEIPYCTGMARYEDMPRGKIMGVKSGALKIVFHRETLTILGVHIIGNIATELIHYGMTLVENKKSVMQVISTVFNYPTLHDLYKYACYDGLGNLSGHKIKI